MTQANVFISIREIKLTLNYIKENVKINAGKPINLNTNRSKKYSVLKDVSLVVIA